MTEENEALRKEIDELRSRLRNLSYQLECMRSLQQIEDALRDLRTNAAKARFAKEGEPGYIPKQSLGDDRSFAVSSDENSARSSTIRDFGYIDERLDKFVLSEYSGDLAALACNLDDFQTIVREEARNSVEHTLNEIALAGCFLTDQLHRMLERIYEREKQFERSGEIEAKGRERLQWASEKIQRGQMPIPD